MKTKIVGICNVTPDSFSDGGKHLGPEIAIQRVVDLFEEGADIVDIGAESTRPGAERISAEVEWGRLEIVLSVLQDLDLLANISLDTYHPTTARQFAEMGGLMLNDVTGFQDPEMVEIASSNSDLICVVSHLPTPTTGEAHKLGSKKIDELYIVTEWLEDKAIELKLAGLHDRQIVLDPGLGFGKTAELNIELLEFPAHTYFPVMVGYSRKKFLGENYMATRTNLDAGRVAIESGAAYLRVHDVAAHVRLRDEMSL